MLHNTLKTPILATFFALFMVAVVLSPAYGYGTGYGEETFSDLQHCNSPYTSRSNGDENRIKRYTGKCLASFDRNGDPLYRYHQYVVCEAESSSKESFSYREAECGNIRYEQRLHPENRQDRQSRVDDWQHYYK